ncbi:U-box domain-containing protein 52-like [Abrus precatorius]|uniref:RING-type E3 ubiquitin transferase n=1 Tax=Abrus precatorius TaxID=3816 RepID=A0A8B8LW37_ABRPR|nr:U-box domain-containing protein 52-like [Abrus precatorius]
MSRFNGEKKLGAGRVVAVAIDNSKTSQHAAKWAVDNLLPKDQCLYLIHVRQKASSAPTSSGNHAIEGNEAVADNESKELFDSFRVFCNRKSIQCKEVLLEDTDVSKALIDSISTYSIELLVLGAPSKGGLVRRFRTTDVPSIVSKGAPPFCTVYIISKGKISSVRSATAPLPKTAPRNQLQPQPQPQPQSQPIPSPERMMDPQGSRNYPVPPRQQKPAYGSRLGLDDDDIISPFTRIGKTYEPSKLADSDISFVSSGRPSIDRMFPSLYDDLDSANYGMAPARLSCGSDFDSRSFASSLSGANNMEDFSFTSQGSGLLSSRLSDSNPDEMEAEMRRLKLELKQTMEMYSTACKEALTAKQKAMELQRWKVEEQKKMEEARMGEEAAMAMVEIEQEKCRTALKTAETSQRIATLEAQKRMNAEMKCQAERMKTESGFGHGTTRYRRYTIEEIEEATNRFSDSLKIGEGGYGPVYRCELDHTQVAIKVLKPDAQQGREQFQQEVEVLSCIRHPNMVLLLGACPEYGCLVYEYMANGSLDDCLFRRGKPRPPLPWQLRFQIAAEIATGLLFLHQTKPEPLVHRDLKPGNILLDRNYVSKISDVGLARLVPPSVADTVTQYRMTSTAGTFCYIDPEYQQTGMLGIKSDIYSLGIMLLQLVTAKPPMGLTHHVGKSIEKGTFAEMLDPAIEDWPLEQTLHFAKLCLQCAEMRRKDRPDLGKVVLPELNKLRTFAEESMPPMMMFGLGSGAAFAPRTSNSSNHSAVSSTSQDNMSESQSLSGISGYESRSSTSSLGRM